MVGNYFDTWPRIDNIQIQTTLLNLQLTETLFLRKNSRNAILKTSLTAYVVFSKRLLYVKMWATSAGRQVPTVVHSLHDPFENIIIVIKTS